MLMELEKGLTVKQKQKQLYQTWGFLNFRDYFVNYLIWKITYFPRHMKSL